MTSALEQVRLLTATEFVLLSIFLECPDCKNNVRYVGEHKANGNWYCPACGRWTERHSEAGLLIPIWKRAQRVPDLNDLFAE